jgi:hypothetical protein
MERLGFNEPLPTSAALVAASQRRRRIYAWQRRLD